MKPFELRTIHQVADDDGYPFTLGQLRHYLLHRHKNGLDKAVVKIGKRLFFRMDGFNEWIANQSEKSGSTPGGAL